MSPTWLSQACITSLVGRPSLCSAGMAGAGTLRREAMMHVCGQGLATIQSHFSGFSKQSGICSKALFLGAGSKVPSQVPGSTGGSLLALRKVLARFLVFVAKPAVGRSVRGCLFVFVSWPPLGPSGKKESHRGKHLHQIVR